MVAFQRSIYGPMYRRAVCTAPPPVDQDYIQHTAVGLFNANEIGAEGSGECGGR